MLGDFDYDIIVRSWRYLFLVGMAFTLKLTVSAMVGGIVIGTLLAMARLSPVRAVSFFAGGYVNLIRSVPLVLVIFWFYFLMPYVGAWITRASQPVQVGDYTSALVTFIMFEAAYYCEIMRAGIQSVARGQTHAAYALGMGYLQMMANVVLPQAFRNMIPLLLTQTIVLFQDVSLVYVLSLTDFVGAADKIAHRDNRLTEPYLFVALVYFILCFSLSWMTKRLAERVSVVR